MKNRCFFILFFSSFSILSFAQNIPYSIEELPDTIYNGQLETVTEQGVWTQRLERFESSPAVFKNEEEEILIKEGFKGYQTPVYEIVAERILIRKAHLNRYMSSPAIYEIRKKKIVVIPARTIFVKRKKNHGSFSDSCYNCKYFGVDTCNWRQLTLPAKIRTLFIPRLKNPPIEKSYKVPALYKTVYKQIIDWEATKKQPSRKHLIEIPSEYQTIKKKILASPSSVTEIVNLIDYETITVLKMVKFGDFIEGLFRECTVE